MGDGNRSISFPKHFDRLRWLTPGFTEFILLVFFTHLSLASAGAPMKLFGLNQPPNIFITIRNIDIQIDAPVVINPRPEPPTDSQGEMGDLQDEVQTMSVNFDRLSAAVNGLPSVVAGIDTTIQHMADQIRSLQGQTVTDEQLGALADSLEASKTTLAGDIVANTAASTETPTPAVVVPVEAPADPGAVV